ncbi:MAG: hypothetical protein LBK01_08295 [Burkholderiaceae bacterium]|jgi:hypothetical protein|nr:hypothetical protein [Burkholderiaceae bacterium]
MHVITIPRRLDEARSEEARERRQTAERRERYGKYNCPDAFVDICWEFSPADAHSATSAPPPWETYEKIVSHLREQPLPLDDERSLKVYQGVRGSLLKALTKKQYAAALADAAHFIQSPRAGDGISAAMLLSALTRTLLPLRLHLSSPDERRLAGEVATLLVPAYERALTELSDAAKKSRLHIDKHGAAYALARAEFCLGSAYEFAAFVTQDPAEKKRLLSKAFAVYARVATQVTEGGYWTSPSAYWVNSIGAFIAASRVAVTDAERLELARHTTRAMSTALRRVTSAERAAANTRLYAAHYNSFSSFRVNGYLYNDVPPGSPRPTSLFGKPPTYISDGKTPDGKTRPMPTRLGHTWINQAILAIWEDCESADARRAAVDTLMGLYAVGKDSGDTYKGAIAMLMLELYAQSGDEHWLRDAPAYLRAGGDSLPASEWKKLAAQARQRRAELVAQLDDPSLCRDADGLVIRWRGDLITDRRMCATVRDLIARHPMVSERRPSRLGAEYGTERYVWERESVRRSASKS